MTILVVKILFFIFEFSN